MAVLFAHIRHDLAIILDELVTTMQHEVQIEWDKEVKVWYIEDSNVPGLVGEAATLEAMMELLKVRIPEMLEENNLPQNEYLPLRLLAITNLTQMHRIN